jgi:hypothetical protein
VRDCPKSGSRTKNEKGICRENRNSARRSWSPHAARLVRRSRLLAANSAEGLYLDKIPSALPQQNPKVRPAKADCGIVPSEANTGVPPRGDFERMARRRFQDPKPFRRGEWWCLQSWRDDFRDGKTQRRKTWAKLAPSSMPEREVRKVAAELLRPLNQGWRASGPQPTLPAT